MTGKRISSADERKLTTAVERAATLAVASDAERSGLLARCLLDSGVDGRFAKAASAAFNKRLSVLTFQRADDSNRADSFPLSDAGTVEELMGESPRERKTASFSIGMGEAPEPASMSKVASARPAKPRVNYEDRVSPDVFETHLVSQMQKLASEHSRLLGDLNALQSEWTGLRKEARAAIARMPDLQVSLLRSRLGETLERAVGGDGMPKTASVRAGVLADTPELRKVAAAVSAYTRYAAANNAMAEFQEHLRKFASDAADLGDNMHKLAANPAGLAGTSYLMMRGIGDSTLATVALLNQARQGMVDNLGSAYNAALALNDHDRPSEAPSKILDSEFLTKDRARDRVLAFSDMSADPLLARLAGSAGALFAATNKAMDLDPRLERPDQRELLRVYVSKLLAQNMRMDDAGMAALSAIESNIGKAPGTMSEKAGEPVHALDKVQAPSMGGDLGKLVDIFGAKADRLSDKLDLSTLQDAAKARQAKDKDNGENNGEKGSGSTPDELRAKALSAIGVRVALDQNKNPIYQLGGGKNGEPVQVDEATINKLVEKYNKLHSL